MYVDAPSFPITKRPSDLDNATLARRALLDLNSALHHKEQPSAPYWRPDTERGRCWSACLVGLTAHRDSALANAISRCPGHSLFSRYVYEVEGRFEGRFGKEPITALQAAKATGCPY